MNLKEYMKTFNIDEKITIDDSQYLPYEIFLPITSKEVDDIKEGWYYISNYSRVYSSKRNKFLKMKINSKTGYYEFTVSCVNKRQKSVLLHRVLMLVFYPDHDEKLNVINHKDGNKLNSFLYNLEFTDTKGNAIHARDSGLLNPSHGEEHCCATITEDTCRNICKLIETRKYTLKEIAKMNNTSLSVVESIKQGKSWKHITKDYDIHFKQERVSKYFTYEELHNICKYFQENPKDDTIGLMDYCRKCLNNLNIEINDGRLEGIRKLYRKQRWKFIYCMYNY